MRCVSAAGNEFGLPWLGGTDGTCSYCARGQENLCEAPIFTGYQIDGGFAEYTVADERFCFHLPAAYSDLEVAPLLCAGLIGYRTYRMGGENLETLGIYGFGAAAHIITQVAKWEGKSIRLHPSRRYRRPGVRPAPGCGLGRGFRPNCRPKSWTLRSFSPQLVRWW